MTGDRSRTATGNGGLAIGFRATAVLISPVAARRRVVKVIGDTNFLGLRCVLLTSSSTTIGALEGVSRFCTIMSVICGTFDVKEGLE